MIEIVTHAVDGYIVQTIYNRDTGKQIGPVLTHLFDVSVYPGYHRGREVAILRLKALTVSHKDKHYLIGEGHKFTVQKTNLLSGTN